MSESAVNRSANSSQSKLKQDKAMCIFIFVLCGITRQFPPFNIMACVLVNLGIIWIIYEIVFPTQLASRICKTEITYDVLQPSYPFVCTYYCSYIILQPRYYITLCRNIIHAILRKSYVRYDGGCLKGLSFNFKTQFITLFFCRFPVLGYIGTF
jgi:hypothetical protein